MSYINKKYYYRERSTMTKKDLVKKAQENLKEKDIKLSLKDVDEAVDAIFLAMMQGLKEEGEVFIKGIISLKVKDVAEKEVPVTVGSTEKKIKPAYKKAVAKLGIEFQNSVQL